MNNVLEYIRRTRKKRKPSRPPRWRAFAIALGVIAVFGALAYGARQLAYAPQLRVRAFEIDGTARIPEYEIRQAVQDAYGSPILLLPLSTARARVQEVPGVASAVVARRMPDLLEIHVVERRPVARTVLGGMTMLVDREGALFSPRAGRPGDDVLPELIGLRTLPSATALADFDRPALRALEALVSVTKQRPPEGTTVDLTPENRIVMRPGTEAPLLWLDRDEPERNLQSLYEWKSVVAEIAPDRAIDLRFPRRLTLPPPPEDDTTIRR